MTIILLNVMLAITSAPTSSWVVEPSMETVVRQLALVPDGAPRGTEPRPSSIARDHLVIRYGIPGGDVAFTLRHPETAAEGDPITERFVISADPDTPQKLTRAFIAHCKQREGPFRWTSAGRPTGAQTLEPLDLARTRLLMADVAGVHEAITRAVKKAGGDPAVLRQGIVLLEAAGRLEKKGSPLELRCSETRAALLKRFQEAISQATAAGSPGLSVELWAVAVTTGDELPPAAEMLSGVTRACSLSRVAWALDTLGRSDEALALVDKVLDNDAGCLEAHHLGAEIIGRRKDWQGLLDRVDAALLAHPKGDGLSGRRATALRGLGRLEEARDLLEAEARKDPSDAGTLSALANLTTMTRTDEESYQALNGACQKDPSDVVSCFLTGVVAHYLAHHQSCVDRMLGLKDALPGQPRVPMYAAISAYYLGKQAQAEALIAKAARIATAMDPDVYYCRSIIIRNKDMDGSIADLERFLRVARYGWHSEGKVERVTEELAMLRRGEIPPPAEAHHRGENEPIPEGARPGGSGAKTAQHEPSAPLDSPEASLEADPMDEGLSKEEEVFAKIWFWIILTGVIGLLAWRRMA